MKPLAAAALLLALTTAHAQGGFSVSLNGLGKALAKLKPGPGPQKAPGQATQPQGSPGNEEKDPRLPEPQDDARPILRLVHADRSGQKGDVVILEGNVQCHYKGYDLYADRIEGNRVTGIFVLSGGAQLVGKDAIVKGDLLIADFDAGTFRSDMAAAQLRPEILQNKLVDDVYLWGREFDGSRREIHAHDGGLTTCNLDHPHYQLEFRNAVIRPGKRIILRETRFKYRNRTLFSIPYMSIPLDEKNERYTPTVGQDPISGWFIKNRFGIPIRGTNILDAYLDYFSKLGYGLGGLYGYATDRFDGSFRAYALTGASNSLELSSRHQQDLGRGMELTLNNDYSSRNQFNSPQNTSLSTLAQLRMEHGSRGARGDYSLLTLSRRTSDAPGFFSRNQVWGLQDRTTFNKSFSTQTNIQFTSNESGSVGGDPVKREQVNLRLSAVEKTSRGTAELEYARSIPVGDVTNFYSGSDKTPVLSFRSTTEQLLGKEPPRGLSLNTELSMGEFADPNSRGHVTRSYFDVGFARSGASKGPLSLQLQGRFRQGVYSDDTAQYSIQFNPTLTYRIGSGGVGSPGLTVRHSYLDQHGFTPLSMDRVGSVNLTTMDLSFNASKTLRLGAQTGYDFLAFDRQGSDTAWQQVGIRAEWTPSDKFQVRAWPVYNTNAAKWGNVRLDATYGHGEMFLSFGARYDAIRHVWGSLNLYAEGLKYGKTKLSFLGAYNGYLNRFESTRYSMIYDLHCWEAVLQVIDNTTGFNSGRQVFFFLRIKAFPFDTPFGVGTRGQPIGTGTGTGY